MDSDYAIRIGRHIKRILFILCRYPAFSASYIRDNIDKPDTDPAELADYRSNCAESKRWRVYLLGFVYLYTLLRNSITLTLWLRAYGVNADQELETDELELRSNGTGGSLRHIYCVHTNCTRLGPLDVDYGNELAVNSQARLVEDVGRLPLHMICNPRLDRFHYTPATRLDAFGTFALALTIYTQFLLGLWIIAQQTVMPSYDDIMMFISAPKVTTQVYRARIKTLMQDLVSSYSNNQSYLRKKLALSRQLLAGAPVSEPESRWKQGALAGRAQVESEQKTLPPEHTEELKVYERSLAASARQIIAQTHCQQAVENCLPIIRTHWWRLRQARIILRVFIMCVLCIVGIGVLAFRFVHRRLKAKLALIKLFEREMARLNCFVWPETAELREPRTAFSLTQVSVNWTLRSFLNATALSVLAACTIALAFALFWAATVSLGVWLAELRMFMVASLLATRFQHLRERAQAESLLEKSGILDEIYNRLGGKQGNRSSDQPADWKGSRTSLFIDTHHSINTHHFYNIPNLRKQFEDTTHLRHIILVRCIERRDEHNKVHYDRHRLNAKSTDRQYADRFLSEMLVALPSHATSSKSSVSPEQFDQTTFDIKTLEQIYINFRLLIDFVASLGLSMRLLVPITYLLNYGVVTLAILFRNRFAHLTAETNFLIVFAFVIANYLIFLVADVHANARQVHPLLWSLIAQLTYSEDPRVRHMRSLWIKQTVMLERDGGLALSCAGLRITYVYIIQLLLWTTTIVGLALKPHALDIRL